MTSLGSPLAATKRSSSEKIISEVISGALIFAAVFARSSSGLVVFAGSMAACTPSGILAPSTIRATCLTMGSVSDFRMRTSCARSPRSASKTNATVTMMSAVRLVSIPMSCVSSRGRTARSPVNHASPVVSLIRSSSPSSTEPDSWGSSVTQAHLVEPATPVVDLMRSTARKGSSPSLTTDPSSTVSGRTTSQPTKPVRTALATSPDADESMTDGDGAGWADEPQAARARAAVTATRARRMASCVRVRRVRRGQVRRTR